MIKQNLHTHSLYCDGINSLEEIVESAIQKKFTVLGFSSHGYTPSESFGMDENRQNSYCLEVNKLKEKYKDQIDIFLGIEQDELYRINDPSQFDYIIGSKHYVKGEGYEHGIDCSKEVTEQLVSSYFNNDFLSFCQCYFDDLKKMATWDEVDIIGHFDLFMKFNEDESFLSFSNKQYLKMAYETLDCLIQNNKIIEVNTGAIAKGYRTKPYPDFHLLQYINQHNGKILLNSDCHNAKFLDEEYDIAMDLIQKAGFKSMEVLTSNGFETRDIDEFIM